MYKIRGTREERSEGKSRADVFWGKVDPFTMEGQRDEQRGSQREQPSAATTSKEELDAPVLLSGRDRNFLVTHGEQDPFYVLGREWVQNPASLDVALEARKRIKTDGIRPYSLGDKSALPGKADAILKELGAVQIPVIEEVSEPAHVTLETHLPRWRALGHVMRLKGAYEKEVGLERLARRLGLKKSDLTQTACVTNE